MLVWTGNADWLVPLVYSNAKTAVEIISGKFHVLRGHYLVSNSN